MVKKLSFNNTLLHKNSNSTPPPSPPPPPPPPPPHPPPPPTFPWPSCKHLRTHSLGAHRFNSARLDSAESCLFTSSSSAESESLSTASEASAGRNAGAADETVEAVIRGLRPDPNRLFFEPGSGSSSIVKNPAPDPAEPEPDRFEGGVAVAVDSEDPYADFRASMEAMVAAHGVKGWDWLEEMLTWYLRANGRATHGLIVGAFVDLLVGISASSTTSNSCTSSSCSSSFSFEIEEENDNCGSLRGDVAKKKRDG